MDKLRVRLFVTLLPRYWDIQKDWISFASLFFASFFRYQIYVFESITSGSDLDRGWFSAWCTYDSYFFSVSSAYGYVVDILFSHGSPWLEADFCSSSVHFDLSTFTLVFDSCDQKRGSWALSRMYRPLYSLKPQGEHILFTQFDESLIKHICLLLFCLIVVGQYLRRVCLCTWGCPV